MEHERVGGEEHRARLTFQPRHEIARVDRHARGVDMHLVGVIALLQSWDGLDVEDVEAAAAAGVDDQVCVLIVFFTPRRIAGAVIARRPWRYYDGELSRQRHHVAEGSDPEARLWTRQIPVGIMRMRA